MKALLTHPTEDLDTGRGLPDHAAALAQDLELETVLEAMAGGDRYVRDVAERVLLGAAPDIDTIVYRQEVLADCLGHPGLARELYTLASSAIEEERQLSFGRFGSEPDTILSRAVRVMDLFVDTLRRMRIAADKHAEAVGSRGLVRLAAMLSDELDEAYLQSIEGYLGELRFPQGLLLSAELGRGNTGVNHVLRRPPQRGRLAQLFERAPQGEGFALADHDERGHKALSELRGRAINGVANALAQSCDHILGFLALLRAELAFYLGAVNLHRRLEEVGAPTCVPTPMGRERGAWRARDLYDPSLALTLGRAPVGNDVDAEGASLVMITGANQGGKSTLLRSVGLAQLMFQAGVFAPAAAFEASPVSGVYSHFPREEDASMQRGKLDEELARMSAIVDAVDTGALVLCNESFASTNEREGSEIARHVVTALREAGVRVAYVTHMYELARTFIDEQREEVRFLRAERGEAGERTYRLAESPPLPTSFGEDTYARVFGASLGQQ